MRALVTGGTGFIGRHLLKRLDRPVILTRDVAKARDVLGDVDARAWDPLAGPPSRDIFAGIDAVINLAGESIGEGRWTKEKKARLRDSRIVGTRHLVQGMAGTSVRVLVSASAVGIYGDRGDDVLDEKAAPGNDFLADLGRAWEAESAKAGVRVVNPRFGIVLGTDGGALPRMMTPIKWFVGGRLGKGTQWMPWVHVDDVVGLLLHVIENDVRGPVNVVAPNPVTNADFTRALASALGRPALFPAPWFALRLVLGEFANFLFMSQRAVPRATEYRFQHPEIGGALKALLAT